MAQPNPTAPVNDDDLLANAIPIPPEELEPDGGESSASTTAMASSKIRRFETAMPTGHAWQRQPNVSGCGATHMKTFLAKLRPEAIDHMDEQINQWLDEHPTYEVKFVSSAIGILQGKNAEQAIFVTVWV